MTCYFWEPPRPFEIPGRPELRFFPERIVLFDRIGSPKEELIRQAIYVPDLSSFRPSPEWNPEAMPGELELYEMMYVSASDLNAEMKFEASLLGGYLHAGKYFQGQLADGVSGGEP